MPVSPTNNMPAPNQAAPISTERVKSNIPKAGTDDNSDGTSQTWVSVLFICKFILKIN